MTNVLLQIDGREVEAAEGMTVLQAARSVGIAIPTLCYHEELQPFGGCRICIVEAEARGRTELVASCVHPVEGGLVVKTRSERIDRNRKTLLELLLAHAPHAPILQELAREYGADSKRFHDAASFCIHCGLCVRYCAEVVQNNAIGFVDRGIRKEICFLPELVSQCRSCKRCFPLCPTAYLQAVFVLTEAMAMSG